MNIYRWEWVDDETGRIYGGERFAESIEDARRVIREELEQKARMNPAVRDVLSKVLSGMMDRDPLWTERQ